VAIAAMNTKQISLVKDFTDCPGGRYRGNGDFSGEEFREDILRPSLAECERLQVDMNHAFTIPPSFLDEAFGPLVEELGEQAFRARIIVSLDDDPAARWEYEDVIEKHSSKKRSSFFGIPRREYA
jgi:hypothetical protein